MCSGDSVVIFCGSYGLRARGTGPLRFIHSAIHGMIPPWAFRDENSLFTYTPRAYDPFVPGTKPSIERNIARLNGSVEKGRESATREGARAAQLPDAVVTSILALERPTGIKAIDAARLFPEYLAAVEQLARYVDTWR